MSDEVAASRMRELTTSLFPLLGMGASVANFLYGLGRFLQLVGLIMLPLAIAGNISPREPLTLWQSLTMTAIGLLVFGLGYYLQQLGKPSN